MSRNSPNIFGRTGGGTGAIFCGTVGLGLGNPETWLEYAKFIYILGRGPSSQIRICNGTCWAQKLCILSDAVVVHRQIVSPDVRFFCSLDKKTVFRDIS